MGLDDVDSVRIAVLLGVGERVGSDTYDWTLDRLHGTVSVRDAGRERQVRALSEPWTATLPGHGGRRLYRYDLADQHVLDRTTDVPSVGTWLCYDSRLATGASVLAVRSGAVEPLIRRVGRNRLVDAMATGAALSPFGGDSFVVMTRVRGRRNGRATTVRRWVRGHDQGRATAVVAATVTQRFLDADLPAGVTHSHESFDVAPFERVLEENGYVVGQEVAGDER